MTGKTSRECGSLQRMDRLGTMVLGFRARSIASRGIMMIQGCIALPSSRARIARGIAPAVRLETELQCELATHRLSSRRRNLGGKYYLYPANSSAYLRAESVFCCF